MNLDDLRLQVKEGVERKELYYLGRFPRHRNLSRNFDDYEFLIMLPATDVDGVRIDYLMNIYGKRRED